MAKKNITGLETPFGFASPNKMANPDEYYGTYDSIQDALDTIEPALRIKGRTVGIIENDSVVEYWWKSGVLDTDLVQKIAGEVDPIESSIAQRDTDGKLYVEAGTEEKHAVNLSQLISLLPTAFTTIWNINDNNLTLPIIAGRNLVDWGDGVKDFSNTHTYEVNGIKTVKIYGEVRGFSLQNSAHKNKITSVLKWGGFIFDAPNIFNGCANLSLSEVSDLPKIETTSFLGMFRNNPTLTNISRFNEWNFLNVTAFTSCFLSCTAFNQSLDLFTPRLTGTASMFNGCTSFNSSVNIIFDNVTNASYMFYNASSFNQDVNHFVTKSLQNTSYMFSAAIAFNKPLNSWDVSNVTTMERMFYGAIAFNQPLGNWNTSKVKNFSRMFYNASAFNQNINSWNVSEADNFEAMFYGATAFNQPLNNWVVSKAKNMNSMFRGATSFSQNISRWDIQMVNDFNAFLAQNSVMGVANLDAIYNTWSKLVLQPNLSISFGTNKYSTTGADGRNKLITDFNWTISDGGLQQ